MTYAEGFERGSQPAPVGVYPEPPFRDPVENPPLARPNRQPPVWYTEPQQAQPFDTRRKLREKLEQTGAALRTANAALVKANDSVAAHVQTIQQLREQERYGDREAQARLQQQSIRLELVKHFGYSDLHDVARQVQFVINGIVPPQQTSSYSAEKAEKDFDETATEPEEQIDPLAPRVRRADLVGVLNELEIVSKRITMLRRDSSISAGKVRIQNIDDRVKGILIDLLQIMEDAQ